MTYPDVLGLLVACLSSVAIVYIVARYNGSSPTPPRRPKFRVPPIPKQSRYEWKQWTTTTTYPVKKEGYLVVIAASAELAMKFANRTDTPIDLGPAKQPCRIVDGRRWGFGLNIEASATSEQDKETT